MPDGNESPGTALSYSQAGTAPRVRKPRRGRMHNEPPGFRIRPYGRTAPPKKSRTFEKKPADSGWFSGEAD